MSHFLHNLIVRHQAAGDSLEASQIIQPRPKSRFEIELNETSNLSQSDSGIEEIISSASKPSSQSPQTAEFHQSKIDNTSSAADTDENDASELTDSMSNLLVEKPTLRETSEVSAHNQMSREIEYQTDFSKSEQQSPGIDVPIERQMLSISDELQPRVHTILHRLNALQSKHDELSSADTFQLDNAISDKLLSSSQELNFIPEQALGYVQIDNVQNKNIKSQSQKQDKRSDTHQSGLMQNPDWLSQLQSELNQRQREISNQIESETVVNVTIGRVEVKAIQTDSAQKPKSSNKPSGIMSLDDYLTKRDKGRA